MNENFYEEKGEFTLKSLFALIKRSAKRILVYGVIAAILGICVAAIIIATTMGNVEYDGAIEYTHSGILDGLDPNGNVLDYSRVKSAAVINAALANMGYNDEQISKMTDVLEENIMVTPYVPAGIAKQMNNDPTYVYNPTRYMITVTTSDKLDMSSKSYTAFVNELMKAYLSYFNDYYKYTVTTVLALEENSVSSAVDYYDLIYSYSNEIEYLQTAIDTLPVQYSVISDKLAAKVSVLESVVLELENYILRNNVRKDDAILSLEDNLNNKIAEYQGRAQTYADRAEGLSALISAYQQVFDAKFSDNSVIVTTGDLAAYNALIEEAKNAILQQSIYSNKAELLTKKKDLIGSTPGGAAERQKVEARFALLYNNFASSIDEINDDLALFAEKEVMNSGVKIVTNAYRVREVSYVPTIIIFFVIVLAGICAAVITTGVKESRMKKNEAEAAVETKEEAPAKSE